MAQWQASSTYVWTVGEEFKLSDSFVREDQESFWQETGLLPFGPLPVSPCVSLTTARRPRLPRTIFQRMDAPPSSPCRYLTFAFLSCALSLRAPADPLSLGFGFHSLISHLPLYGGIRFFLMVSDPPLCTTETLKRLRIKSSL